MMALIKIVETPRAKKYYHLRKRRKVDAYE